MNQSAFLMRILCLFFVIIYQTTHAQIPSSLFLTPEDNGKTIRTVIDQADLEIIIEEKHFGNTVIQGIQRKTNLVDFIKKYHPDQYFYDHDGKVILLLDAETAEFVKSASRAVIVFPVNSTSNKIKGTITDAETGADITGANIYLPKSKTGDISDISGAFEIDFSADVQALETSYAGYQKQQILLVRSKTAPKAFLELSLSPGADLLETVTVVAARSDANITSRKTGIVQLKIAAIKQLPSFLGEIDPVRSISTLPGVSSTGDLAAGFNVRGGENSQNLILQDGAIIFNPTHLFGFFSSFNPDFISDVALLKGGGPAQFGGRVSSVLDINTRNGNLTKYSISGGLGLISSRLTLEGPIVKDKSSLILGGRVSYSNWFIQSYEDPDLNNSAAAFYDLTGKYYQQINKKNYATVTAYQSADSFKLGTDSTYSWQTQNVSMKWDRIINERSRSAVHLASSNYSSKILNENQINGYTNTNGVNVITADYQHEFAYSPAMKFQGGLNNNFSWLHPGNLTAPTTSATIPLELPTQKALEVAGFVEGDFDLKKRWAISAGLRYGHFFRLGADEIYTLDFINIENRTATIKETLQYGSGDLIANYGGFEPRVSVRFLARKNISLKAGFTRTQQFLHQVSPTISPSPLDFWISSSPQIKPQRSNQYSLGYFHNFKDNNIETSLEGFYKKTSNTIDYIDGVDLNFNPLLEAGLTQGKGIAYGLEFLLKKKQGKFNGWLAYTYSRSFRYFDSPVPTQSINGGKRYRSAFDQPHQVSFVLNTEVSSKVVFSTNFTYNSGRPITIPVSKYSYDDYLSVNNYSERNAFRMPAYHRLDISLTIKGQTYKRYSSELILSIYNLYARKNAFAIFFNNKGQAFKTSILGTALPSISYNFKIK